MDNSEFQKVYLTMKDMESVGNNMLYYEQFPQYDLFLSQVVDFLNVNFPDENYTSNIIQNYIKSEVISVPIHGKKRGYARHHLIQLALISYMRPLLTTDEIKKVFALAFNNINDHQDDIITWDLAYQIFIQIQKESLNSQLSTNALDEKKISGVLNNMNLSGKNAEKIYLFLTVLTLIAHASTTKKIVQKVVETSDVNI